jgi:hypothetical protein
MTDARALRTSPADIRPPKRSARIARARGLLAPPDAASTFGARSLQALQDRPAVVLAHRDLVTALDDHERRR